MSYFVKAYSITVTAIIACLLAVALLLIIGNNGFLFGTNSQWAQLALIAAFYLMMINFAILILVAMPFYALIVKFSRFGFIASVILGVLVGIAHRLALMTMLYKPFIGDGFWYFILLGAIFGVIFFAGYAAFNKREKITSY